MVLPNVMAVVNDVDEVLMASVLRLVSALEKPSMPKPVAPTVTVVAVPMLSVPPPLPLFKAKSAVWVLPLLATVTAVLARPDCRIERTVADGRCARPRIRAIEYCRTIAALSDRSPTGDAVVDRVGAGQVEVQRTRGTVDGDRDRAVAPR